MVKYFIESPDGRWLMRPDQGYLTDNPFRAWAFEENREPLKWLTEAPKNNTPDEYKWPGIKSEDPGSYVLCPLQEDGCLKGFKITRQEFSDDMDYHKGKVIINSAEGIKHTYKNGMKYTSVNLPMFDQNVCTLTTIGPSTMMMIDASDNSK